MPKVIIDTTEVPDGEFKPYEGPEPKVGLYRAVWKRGWWTKSSSGKPMVKLIFEFQTTHEEKKQYNGYAIWHNITNEPSTAWKMKELFKALGTGLKSGIDFDDKGVITRIGSAIPGKAAVLITTKMGSYQGKAKLEIATLAPLPNTQSTDDIDDIDAEVTGYDESGEMAENVSAAAASGDENEGFGAMADEQWASENEPPF